MKLTTRHALAGVIGVSDGTVSRYLRRDDWPAPRVPPWSEVHVRRIRDWRSTLQEDRSREPSNPQLSQAKTMLVVESAKLKQLQRQQRERNLVSRDLVEATLAGMTAFLMTGLDEMTRDLPAQLVGLEPAQAEKVLHDRIRALRDKLSQRQTIDVKVPAAR